MAGKARYAKYPHWAGLKKSLVDAQTIEEAIAAAPGGVTTKIESADGKTKVDVDETPGENKVRMDVNEVEAFLLSNLGILTLAKQPTCKAYRGTNQTIGSGAFTKIEMANESYDSQNEYNTTTMKYTATEPGTVALQASMTLIANLDGKRLFGQIRLNGGTIAAMGEHGAADLNLSCQVLAQYELAANDELTVWAYQENGVNKNLYGTANDTFLLVHKLG